MHVDDPVFSMFGDDGGVKRCQDGAYAFDGAAGSAGISFQFPDGWKCFNTVVFFIEARNLRPTDGAMALIVNDGYQAWRPPVAKVPYPWVSPGVSTLSYPASVFASGAVSFQLNETFGHSTNWTLNIRKIEFHMTAKNYIFLETPTFAVHGDTQNTDRNLDGSYTFLGDASALLSFHFPQGWDDFENVSFFIDRAENHVNDMTMSLIVKNRYKSWATINQTYGDRYPNIEMGDNNVLTYPTSAFVDGASLQLNQYGHSMNWTMRIRRIVFHDGPASAL